MLRIIFPTVRPLFVRRKLLDIYLRLALAHHRGANRLGPPCFSRCVVQVLGLNTAAMYP